MGRNPAGAGVVIAAIVLGQACSEPYLPEEETVPPPADGPRLRLVETEHDFGAVACSGTPPQGQTFTLENTGGAPLTWSATVSDEETFELHEPSQHTLAPGESAQVVVVVRAPALTAGPPGSKGVALVRFSSNDPVTPVAEATVQFTRTGAELELVPRTVAFGDVQSSTAPELAAALTNRGDQPIEVLLSPSDHPNVAIQVTAGPLPQRLTLAPGQSVEGLVVRLLGTTEDDVSTTVPISTNAPTCGAALSGIPVTAKRHVGTVFVQPGMLDFGRVGCGEAPAAQHVSIRNGSSTAFMFEATLGRGADSPYAIDLASGLVSGNATETIKVTPKPVSNTAGVGDELHSDTLTITTTAQRDSPHVVELRMSPRGVVFVPAESAISFGAVPIDGPGLSRALVIRNEGNVAGTLNFLTDSPIFSVAPPAVEVAPSSAAVVFMRCKPREPGNVASTIRLATSSQTCKPLPVPLDVACSGS